MSATRMVSTLLLIFLGFLFFAIAVFGLSDVPEPGRTALTSENNITAPGGITPTHLTIEEAASYGKLPVEHFRRVFRRISRTTDPGLRSDLPAI